MKRIQSPSNPLVKTLRRLAHPRRRESLFLLEGRKLVETALESGFELESVVISTKLAETEVAELESLAVELNEIGDALFHRISSLKTPEGVVAVARRPSRSLDELLNASHVVVSVGIQDPGNLGAIARVAEAAGAGGLVVVKGSADPFGPKAVRGSMGSILRLPVVEIEDEVALKGRGFRLVGLVPRGGTDFRDFDWRPPLALLLGRESQGLGRKTLAACDAQATIPMKGGVESLNVATAAALALYEATRRGREKRTILGG